MSFCLFINLNIVYYILYVICYIVFSGTGRSKKSAKRAAAHSMLLRIQSLQAEGTNTPVIEDSEEDEIPLVSKAAYFVVIKYFQYFFFQKHKIINTLIHELFTVF